MCEIEKGGKPVPLYPFLDKMGQAQCSHMLETWEELEESIINCSKCKLCKTRQNIVFGVGNKEAKIMLIGEGPGADEDRLRRTICRKSRKINEYGLSNSGNEKRRALYCQYCKM